MVSVTVEDGLEIVGDNHRYQFILAILLFLIGVISDIPFHSVPIMETNPIVYFESNNQNFTEILNYTICKNYNFTINTTISKKTWVSDYNISCDKFYVSSIGFFALFGGLIGTIALHFLKEKPRKWPFILMGILICISSILLIRRNIFLLLTYNIICCMAGVMIYVWRINTISDISSKTSRSYHINFQLSSSSFCLIILFFLFNNDVNWLFIFFGTSIILLILLFFFHRVYIENPRFYYLKGDKDRMLDSLLRIGRFNKFHNDPLFMNKLNTFIRYLKFGDSSKYDPAINHPPGDNIIIKENSIVDVYTSENVAVNTQLNTEEIIEISKKQKWIFSIYSKNFIYFNFLIAAPLCSFLAFIYNFEIKKLSYDMNMKIYVFSFLSIIMLFLLSPFMNLIGRKLSKLITLMAFLVILLLLKFYNGYFSESYMYLINRMIIHIVNQIDHTHLNESFPTKKRLLVFNLTHLISKFLLLSAPLIYEYLENSRLLIEFTIIFILIICYLFQQETANKKLEDH